jgi:hypothetical protein
VHDRGESHLAIYAIDRATVRQKKKRVFLPLVRRLDIDDLKLAVRQIEAMSVIDPPASRRGVIVLFSHQS